MAVCGGASRRERPQRRAARVQQEGRALGVDEVRQAGDRTGARDGERRVDADGLVEGEAGPCADGCDGGVADGVAPGQECLGVLVDRGAAFAACEWLIRELKRTVPIWKKEVYADGEEWIEGEIS